VTRRNHISSEPETAPQAADEAVAPVDEDDAAITDPDELRDEIAATREDLGETVQALADKADVKARAREKIGERKQQAEQTAEQALQQVRSRPLPFATAGALLAGMIIGAFLRRRR
jgi:anti-sigma factor RsiW